MELFVSGIVCSAIVVVETLIVDLVETHGNRSAITTIKLTFLNFAHKLIGYLLKINQ